MRKRESGKRKNSKSRGGKKEREIEREKAIEARMERDNKKGEVNNRKMNLHDWMREKEERERER